MIEWIFNFLMVAVMIIVRILLAPIDLLIATLMPDLSAGLNAVGEFLTMVASGLGWAISAAGIPWFAIALIGSFYIFKLTIPLNVWAIKLAFKWYRTIKT